MADGVMADERLLIIGRRGQLARALARLRPDALVAGSAELDLAADPEAVAEAFASRLDHERPNLVLNAAAYTAVDRAEDPTELGRLERINSLSPGVMARECGRRGIAFVQASTDYVFSGEGTAPWREEDPTEPLNAYGRSKLAGERAVALSGGGLIVRTSWVFDGTGTNFLTTMLRLGAEREELKVVDDQVGAPTYALHLAQAILDLAGRAKGPGVYHLAASGETSWWGFARRIFEEARRAGRGLRVQRVIAIPSSGYPTPARRPLNSRLSTEKASRERGVSLPSWEIGLAAAMAESR